jgi:hypothetical protein
VLQDRLIKRTDGPSRLIFHTVRTPTLLRPRAPGSGPLPRDSRTNLGIVISHERFGAKEAEREKIRVRARERDGRNETPRMEGPTRTKR